MDRTGAWQRCRLVLFDGSSPGVQVGPAGPCASAAWSPDGRWMYFSGDGRRSFASVAAGISARQAAASLWRLDLRQGEKELVLPGLHILGYDILGR